jgi:hypothetical protein
MWTVLFDDDFLSEFKALDQKVRIAILQHVKALESAGTTLGRPFADTLKGSAYRNMKELRPTVNKVEWRVAFAFDPKRQAIVLAAVAKGGKKTAYTQLINTADARFKAHLARIKEEESHANHTR